jgi:hypothetical protein
MAAMLLSAAAWADPGYYVVTPYPTEGVRTVDFRYWTVKPDGWGEVVWPELGFGWGVTSRWTTELFMSWIGSSTMATAPSSLNWQNDYLLTQGERPYDLAVHTQLISDREYKGEYAFEIGPVWQTDIGRTQLNANLFLARGIHTSEPTITQLKYQWQVRHRWQRGLHFGLQGFGELGRWNHWDAASAQSHRAGPAVFSTWYLSEHEAIHLQAAWLVGKVYATRGHMFTLRAHYDF